MESGRPCAKLEEDEAEGTNQHPQECQWTMTSGARRNTLRQSAGYVSSLALRWRIKADRYLGILKLSVGFKWWAKSARPPQTDPEQHPYVQPPSTIHHRDSLLAISPNNRNTYISSLAPLIPRSHTSTAS